MIDHDATTIWERWDGWTPEHGFQTRRMNSLNHYSLGSVGEWLYRFVLGIGQEPATTGFGRLSLRPHPGGGLERAEGSYESVRGTIRAGWTVMNGRIAYSVELPANTRATVHVPSGHADEVRDARGNPPAAVGAFPGCPRCQRGDLR
jgi:alpha-L-rhamnosidase